MAGKFQRYCKRGHDKLNPVDGFKLVTRVLNGVEYEIYMCRRCQNEGQNRRRSEAKRAGRPPAKVYGYELTRKETLKQ